MVTTKEKIIETANIGHGMGGFIDTDGDWCLCTTPASLKKHVESLGFEVIDAISTARCSAKITTADGYVMAYNGFVRKV